MSSSPSVTGEDPLRPYRTVQHGDALELLGIGSFAGRWAKIAEKAKSLWHVPTTTTTSSSGNKTKNDQPCAAAASSSRSVPVRRVRVQLRLASMVKEGFRRELNHIASADWSSRQTGLTPRDSWVSQTFPSGSWCVFTSLPDICEMVGEDQDLQLEDEELKIFVYKLFFKNAVKAVLCALPTDSLAVFYQTDVKPDFQTQVSKASLVTDAVRELEEDFVAIDEQRIQANRAVGNTRLEANLLHLKLAWHKIAADAFDVPNSNGKKPGFTHLLCVRKGNPRPSLKNELCGTWEKLGCGLGKLQHSVRAKIRRKDVLKVVTTVSRKQEIHIRSSVLASHGQFDGKPVAPTAVCRVLAEPSSRDSVKRPSPAAADCLLEVTLFHHPDRNSDAKSSASSSCSASDFCLDSREDEVFVKGMKTAEICSKEAAASCPTPVTKIEEEQNSSSCVASTTASGNHNDKKETEMNNHVKKEVLEDKGMTDEKKEASDHVEGASSSTDAAESIAVACTTPTKKILAPKEVLTSAEDLDSTCDSILQPSPVAATASPNSTPERHDDSSSCSADGAAHTLDEAAPAVPRSYASPSSEDVEGNAAGSVVLEPRSGNSSIGASSCAFSTASPKLGNKSNPAGYVKKMLFRRVPAVQSEDSPDDTFTSGTGTRGSGSCFDLKRAASSDLLIAEFFDRSGKNVSTTSTSGTGALCSADATTKPARCGEEETKNNKKGNKKTKEAQNANEVYEQQMAWSHDVLPAFLHKGGKADAQLKHRTRCMGVECTKQVLSWVKDNFTFDGVVDPFCGSGTVLAVAEALGFEWTSGCDLSRRRVRQAQGIKLSAAFEDAISGAPTTSTNQLTKNNESEADDEDSIIARMKFSTDL
ncbi:unnamed protein product [Amoebophrya sp. A120]|nr:unnamed protein product [Amoebophrya sp. A120]|eukprot:GSA120T00019084001.1